MGARILEVVYPPFFFVTTIIEPYLLIPLVVSSLISGIGLWILAPDLRAGRLTALRYIGPTLLTAASWVLGIPDLLPSIVLSAHWTANSERYVDKASRIHINIDDLTETPKIIRNEWGGAIAVSRHNDIQIIIFSWRPGILGQSDGLMNTRLQFSAGTTTEHFTVLRVLAPDWYYVYIPDWGFFER